MSKHKKRNYDCEHCDNAMYIGDGEFVCEKTEKIVMENFVPTEDYQRCNEREAEHDKTK